MNGEANDGEGQGDILHLNEQESQERTLGEKLKKKLGVDYNAFRLLNEFQRYQGLLDRPRILAAVRPNREQLVVKLTRAMEDFQSQLDKKEYPMHLIDMSETINQVYHLRQMKYKVKEVGKMGEKVLTDLPSYSSLQEILAEVSHSINTEEKRCIKKWTDETLQGIRTKELTLKQDGQVIEFTDGKQMEVTYNPKLAIIIEEAQQLLILGYQVPREIRELVAEAKKFLRHAKELDQIASFHNTIGDRMILSQRPMMLDTAVTLSKMVQEQDGVKWCNTHDVQAYIDKLTTVVNNLARQNNYLSHHHLQLKSKVLILFETDLLKQPHKWKSILKDIRNIFKDVENQGFKNMKSWQNHWDRQLYKALEVQYLQGLSAIHENLPEIQAELVYRQQKLQFKPPLEELRTKYYGNVRKFLSIPLNFKGVNEDSSDESIFPIIVKRHCHKFEKIYKVGEEYFDKIEKLKDRFSEWTAMGSVDVDTLSKNVLKKAEDWDRYFRSAKTKAQEIIKLNCSDEKICCFVISFKLLRLDIELLNRKYWEILVMLLNNSIIEEMATAEMFLTDGIEKLKEDPQTVEEITRANTIKEQLSKEIGNIRGMLESIEQKNKTLSTWTKEKIELGRLKTLWENFSSLLENHQHVVGRQVENIKVNLKNQARIVNNEVENFQLRWEQLKPKDAEQLKDPKKFDQAIKFLHEMRGEWNQLMERKQKVAESCESLSVENVEFPMAEDLDLEMKNFETTWTQLEEFRKGMKEFEEEDWIIFRAKPYRFEEFLLSWEEKFRAQPAKSDFVIRVLHDIEGYKTIIPNLKYLRGDIFSEKHWYELFSLMKMPSKQLGELKLGDFLLVKDSVADNIKELKELNTRASGEITVRQALSELDAWEIESRFNLTEHQDSKTRAVFIIQDFKSVLNKLGDNQSLLQSMKTSPFYSHFADRITMWENRLGDLDEFLQNLNKIQRKWIYLEPIFGHGVLDTESQRFRRIDEDFRSIMDKVHGDSRVVNICKLPGIRNRLKTLQDQLSRCQSSLNDFLEKKRSAFPRFYFIGDDDLLEILGQSTKPSVIQAHLKKLFAGIHSVEFDDKVQNITAMKSLQGEIVVLKRKVKVTSHVEEWLGELSNEMKCTLKSLLLECLSEKKDQSRSPDKYPSQILSVANSITFTEKCEEAIRSGRLGEFRTTLQQELDAYTHVTINASHPNPKVLELKLKELILDVIHEIEVVEFLISKRIRNANEWAWQKQLRFYMDDEGTAKVKMADAAFAYSYEYQGNAPKLVHTPLTDKCYLTMTQAMRMGLSSNPYGPAGSGKTESVKNLGALLGRQVLVFNCDEGIDVKSMGRIFVGLVKCGAWGCFDEFNRLDGATLSAISMQIQPIQTALKQGSSTVHLMEENVKIDPNTGIFVTLNPAGKGYGARNKLPDNLKQLFRPVVMSQPDNERISEVILYTEGFKDAKSLGRKLVEIFNLAGKLLTPQIHYDWGLRALKTVLKGCGSALKQFKKDHNSVATQDEADIAVSTLRLNTLPKLTYGDCFRFDSLVKDVFPDVTFKDLGYQELADKIRESYVDLKFEVNENQIRKCVELYEQLQQRMGVVIVGPPCCGKTTIIRLLKTALKKMGFNMKNHILNPKAMPKTHLLGYINLDTRQWTDGVLTLKAQEVYSEPNDVTSWIVCDGDIDPEWVEALNSVLDDNHLMTLPSGWRIKFGPNVNFIFETHDLSHASPATISRMGMIFMSEEDADIKGIISSWIKSQDEETQRILPQLIEDYFYKGLEWVRKQTEVAMQLPLIAIVKNALSLMANVKSTAHMTVALIRGLGAHLNPTQSAEFAREVLSWTGQSTGDQEDSPLNCFVHKSSQSLDFFKDEQLGSNTEFGKEKAPLVQTADVKRVLDHVKPWLENQQSFLLMGPEGCGKTMLLDYSFSELRSTEVVIFHCSSLISPESVLQKLSQVCVTMSTNAGRVYKSKDGERLILYFKDLNLVKPDKWGTCQLIEFLNQLISYGGFYDKDLEWVTLQGMQIVASITVGNTSGRYPLSPRFTSVLRVCSMSQPESLQLFTITQSYLNCLLTRVLPPNHFIMKQRKEIEQLAKGMVSVYHGVRSAYTPVHQSHYQFTPRDLIKWVKGFMRYNIGDESSSSEQMSLLYSAWISEGCRLFMDKLVTGEEKRNFYRTIMYPVVESWAVRNVESLMDGMVWVSGPFWTAIQNPSATLSTSGFSTDGSPSTLHRVKLEEFQDIVGKAIVAYSRENKELKVVITQEMLDNVAYLDRILADAPSSVVLAGRAGFGRKTALCLVSVLQAAEMFTLKVGRNYTLKSFKTDLKTAIQQSAVEGNKTFLIVEDFQLVDPVFLDMLNSLISSGEVPGLYTPEELEAIVVSLRDTAASEGYGSSLYSYFAQRVQQKLHVILVMDHTHPKFIKNCQSNPSIYKLCNMIWMDSWNEDTLRALPQFIVEKFYKEDSSAEFRLVDSLKQESFVKAFLNIYRSLSVEYMYPRRYASLIHTHASLFSQKKSKIIGQIDRLKAGLSRLTEAKSIVEKLRREATMQEKTLGEKQEEANRALEMITITMKSANMQRGEIEKLREKTLKESQILKTKKKAIDKELEEVEPLVQKARSAVGSIKSESISEIRSLRAPPEVIRDILEGVLRLMGIGDMSWNSMKSFLSKRGVKDEIRNFDARTINSSDREAVEKLLKSKQDSFDPKNAKRASAAAAPLAEWVSANVKYSRVLEKIEPLEKQQKALQENLQMTEGHMTEISSELSNVEDKVQELKQKLNQCTKEAAEIEFHLSKAKETLSAAEGLVGKLQDEFSRWEKELQDLTATLEHLPSKGLLAAAFITYLCETPEDVRQKYVNMWQEEVGIQEYDFCKFLSTERDLLHWQSLGLPSDRLSQENAIIILQLAEGNISTTLRPYLIDPSSRATEWLKNHLSSQRQISVVSLHDPKFPHELELSVRFGKILIIVEADTIEPILLPLLRGDLISHGSREVVQIGDKLVDYNPEFRVFLTTRNPNPHISPDAAAVVTIVNFTTTKAGLTSQLLSTTLSHEKPEIQAKKTELLKNTEDLKIKLDQLEDSLLQQLASAQGNILENKELLESLNSTKKNSGAIGQRLTEASSVEEVLNKEIDVYLPFAQYGSRLYFTVIDLTKLNPMYQFSLSGFIHLFQKALKSSASSSSIESRILSLKRDLESLVYENVCRSLFKEDRLPFALFLAHAMHPKHFQNKEWEAFTSQLVTDMKSESLNNYKKQLPSWVQEDRGFALYLLQITFPDLYATLRVSEDLLWSQFSQSIECENHIPDGVREKITPFQTLMVIQTLRPDRLHTMMTNFARFALGRKSLYPPPMNLRSVLEDSVASEPILIIISAGADCSQELKELAQNTIGLNKYTEIAMGQGQADIALQKIKHSAQVGEWVCLKNLHLAIHWLEQLEKEIKDLRPHDKFRLWLTSEPHTSFPKILAQSCLKVAYEAPQGLKKNLQQTFGHWSKSYFTGDKNFMRSQSLFTLALFHAVVQERRTYIPQGWTKSYEFNDSDLRAGADVLEQMFRGNRSNKEIQWEYIHGVFENAIYGGRIDNEFDNRVLVSYLQEYFNEYVVTGANSSKKSIGPGIKLPSSVNAQDFMSLIDSIPEQDKPSVFGLPGNIERSWQRITSSQIVTKLKHLHQNFSEKITFEKSKWSQDLSPILALWKKLNQGQGTTPLLQQKVRTPDLKKSETEDPLEAFVKLEFYNIVTFLQSVHKALGHISKTIRGISVPSEDILTIADELLRRQTPETWLDKWDGPTDPTVYLQSIVAKAVAIQKWLDRVKSNDLLNNPVDMSDLINPETFLSAFKQCCARKYRLSMDELQFVCKWTSSNQSRKHLTCRLTGLILEGCIFDGIKLSENSSDSAPRTKAPDCVISWIPCTETKEKEIISEQFFVPLYSNESRDRTIARLELPSNGLASKWIQAGIALFLRS